MTTQTSPASLHLLLWYRNYFAKPIDTLQVTQRTLDILGDNTAEAQEEPITASFIAYLITGFLRKSSLHFPLIPPFLSRWVKIILTCYTSPVISTYIYPERLGCMIWISATHNRAFSVLRMIFIHVPLDQEIFLYEDGGHSILCSYCIYVVFRWAEKNICSLVCLIPQPFEV